MYEIPLSVSRGTKRLLVCWLWARINLLTSNGTALSRPKKPASAQQQTESRLLINRSHKTLCTSCPCLWPLTPCLHCVHRPGEVEMNIAFQAPTGVPVFEHGLQHASRHAYLLWKHKVSLMTNRSECYPTAICAKLSLVCKQGYITLSMSCASPSHCVLCCKVIQSYCVSFLSFCS